MAERRDRTYHVVITLFRALFRGLDIRFDVRGAEHIPATGPAVLACNHIGYLDFTFVGVAAARRQRLVRFMAKSSTFGNPVSGPLMRRMHHIPVDRDGVLTGAAAYRHAVRELQAGELVGVFPESTISRSWTLRAFKPGAAALAVREQVPLVPVVTWGGHRIATVEGRVALRRHVPVTVLVGAAVEPDGVSTREQVGAVLRSRLQDLLDTAQRDYPDAGAGRWWQPLHLDGTAPTPSEAAVREAEVDEARLARKHARKDGKAREAARDEAQPIGGVSSSASDPSDGSASTRP